MENSTLTIRRIDRGYAREVYAVYGDVSAYTDDELMDMCDRYCFGGNVHRHESGAIVEVYID